MMSWISIQEFSRRTGVPASTLRTWERRYGVPAPQREANGRRTYHDSDIALVTDIRKLAAFGYRVGQVLEMPVAERKVLIEAEARKGDASLNVSAAVNAAILEDVARFEALVEKARGSLPQLDLVTGFIMPTLRRLGTACGEGDIAVPVVHAAVEILKRTLVQLGAAAPRSASGKRIVFATLEGEMHEMGALCGWAVSRIFGLDSVYLGPNLPPDACGAIPDALGASTLVLSDLTRPAPVLDSAFDRILNIAPSLDIWMGGVDRFDNGGWSRSDVSILPDFHQFTKRAEALAAG